MKVEILKSEMNCGNTMIAAAAQAFKVRNTTKHIKVSLCGYISVFKSGAWTDYDYFVDSDKFTFITAK